MLIWFYCEICLAGQELLIIYEREAEQWAAYLHSVFAGPISEAGICRYEIATVSSRRDDFLRLTQYTCKLLILSKGMLEGLCQLRRFFLARVLTPAARVVVLLCGVDSLTRLLDLVPVDGNECLLISSEQDAQEYLSTVVDIVRRGMAWLQNVVVWPFLWTSKQNGTHYSASTNFCRMYELPQCRLRPFMVPDLL